MYRDQILKLRMENQRTVELRTTQEIHKQPIQGALFQEIQHFKQKLKRQTPKKSHFNENQAILEDNKPNLLTENTQENGALKNREYQYHIR